jgi:hypothetical protein
MVCRADKGGWTAASRTQREREREKEEQDAHHDLQERVVQREGGLQPQRLQLLPKLYGECRNPLGLCPAFGGRVCRALQLKPEQPLGEVVRWWVRGIPGLRRKKR